MEKQSKQTTKKVKIVGKQTYINANTGEIQEMAVTSVEERDFDFTKVWMKSFISSLDIVGNQKTKFCYWIIDHIDKENRLCYTYRQLANLSGISLDTVRVTMGLLMEADFLRKFNNGVYIINPNILYKGSKTARLNVLTQYSDSEIVPISKEEKIKNLQASIASLQKQLEKLENE